MDRIPSLPNKTFIVKHLQNVTVTPWGRESHQRFMAVLGLALPLPQLALLVYAAIFCSKTEEFTC